MNKRLFTGVFFLVLLAFMAGQSYSCPILKAIIGRFDVRPAKPTWVYAGGGVGFVACESVGSIVNCTWSLPGASDVHYEDHLYPNAHVSCKYSTVGVYTATLTVRDSQGRTDTDTCTVYVVSIGIVPVESSYVAVNNDDDNENGIMDMCEDGTVDNEGTQPYDLRKILLSVNTPKPDDKVTLSVWPDGEPRIQVWSHRDKRNRIIPRSVPNEPDEYYVVWPSGSVPAEVYVEAASYASAPGNHPYVALSYTGVNRSTTPPTDEIVFGNPPPPVSFTFLEVDMDIDGLRDDYYTYWKFTDETMPGGFIPLNDLVKIELKQPLPTDLPITYFTPVIFDVPVGDSKIKMWENENKTGEVGLPRYYYSRWDLPDNLWVEGIETSSAPRDIQLRMRYIDFEDRIKLTVYALDKVEFETYMDNDGPDGHPSSPPNGGKRIFPDKKTYDDPYPDRRTIVTVKATITPAIDNKHVYFKNFDVDDPSPVDADTTGPDNNGGNGALSTNDAVTEDSGEARVRFAVTMNPGDNFRIAASVCQDRLNETVTTQAMADADTPPPGVKFTPMLTVWRHLWIERDSMGPVASSGPEKNYVSGTASRYELVSSPPARSRAYLGQNLPDELDDENQFYPGRYRPTNRPAYSVFFSSGFLLGEDYVEVSGDLNADGAANTYDLFDDDYHPATLQPYITLPSYPNLNTYADEYRRAYIEPVYLGTQYSDIVPFDRNLYASQVGWGSGNWNDQRDCQGSESFWHVLVVSAYQGDAEQDTDGDSVEFCGATNGDEEIALYLETTRDAGKDVEHVMAHEIGHTGDLVEGSRSVEDGHCANTDCIMQAGSSGTQFCDECIIDMRVESTW